MSNNKEIVRATDYRTLKFQILTAQEMYEQGQITNDEYQFILLELEKDLNLLRKSSDKKFNKDLVKRLLGFDGSDSI